jgi:hypothetical protein
MKYLATKPHNLLLFYSLNLAINCENALLLASKTAMNRGAAENIGISHDYKKRSKIYD